MPLTQCSLSDFAARRDRLAAMLEDLAGVFKLLKEPARETVARNAGAVLNEQRFRLIVMGAMKHGKSTLINALLGEELLPSQVGVPCTAIPIAARFGSKRRAICYPRSGGSPLECDPTGEFSTFWEAVTIPPNSRRLVEDDDAWAMKAHKFDRAEILAPIPLLENGVEIHDSAGLNEDSRRTQATWDQVRSADAIIVVFDCAQVGTQTDREDLARIVAEGRDPRIVFVVWNKLDQCRDDPQFARLQAEAKAVTDPIGVGADHAFLVSAKEALEGRTRGAEDLVAVSGLPAFENALAQFLVEERSAAKLLNSLTSAGTLWEEAGRAAQRRADQWLEPVQRDREAATRAAQCLKRAKGVVDRLMARLEPVHNALTKSVDLAAKTFVEEHQDGVREAVCDVSLSSREAVMNTRGAVRQLVGAAEEWLRKRGEAWERDVLGDLISDHRMSLGAPITDARLEMESFATEVRGIAKVLGIAGDEEDEHDPDARTGLDHLWATPHKLAVWGSEGAPVGSLGTGALLGGTVGVWLAIVIGAHALPLIIAAVLLGMLFGGARIAEVLKERVAEKVVAELRRGLPELRSRLSAQARGDCHKLDSDLRAEFDRAVAAIAETVDQIQEHRESTEQLAKEHESVIEQVRSRLENTSVEWNALRREIDPLRNPSRLGAELAGHLQPALDRLAATIGQFGGDGKDAGPSIDQMRITLGKDGWEKLESVRACFQKRGVWKPPMERWLALAWSYARKYLGPKAAKQEPAFWTVAALAIAKGEPNLPPQEDVRKFYCDEEYRRDLIEVFSLVHSRAEAARFADDQPGEVGPVGAAFCLAYKRAMEKLGLDKRDRVELRWGTVIHATWHRDPAWPEE